MATDNPKPAAILLRERIASARKSALLAASGFGDILPLLDRYVLETEVRIARLECSGVRRGEGG